MGWLGGRVGWVGLYPVLVCDWLIGLVLDLLMWLGWAGWALWAGWVSVLGSGWLGGLAGW